MDKCQQNGSDPKTAGVGIAIAVAAVPLLYVLLLGPAARIYDSCPPSMKVALSYVYSPLEWLDDRTPGEPFSKYVELWEP